MSQVRPHRRCDPRRERRRVTELCHSLHVGRKARQPRSAVNEQEQTDDSGQRPAGQRRGQHQQVETEVAGAGGDFLPALQIIGQRRHRIGPAPQQPQDGKHEQAVGEAGEVAWLVAAYLSPLPACPAPSPGTRLPLMLGLMGG